MASSFFQSVRHAARGGTLDRFGNSLEDQVEALKDELESLSRQLAKRGEKEGKRLRRQAESGMDDLSAASEAVIEELRDLYGRSCGRMGHTLRRHPVATIGTVAAIGLLIALATRRPS